MNKIGLVAGEGALPRLVAQNALKQGYQVYILAINLKSFIDLEGKYTNAVIKNPAKLKESLNFFHENEIKDILVIGKVKKLEAISKIPFLDEMAKNYLKQLFNFEDNSFHNTLQNIMKDNNLNLIPQSYFLKDLFVEKAVFSKRQATEQEQIDLNYGIEMAEKAAALEVSQCVVVKNSSVMAFEAAEGTDETIKRGCKMARKNAVIVKLPWKKQSEFFDLPTVGPKTMETIIKYKGSLLAIKAKETFVVDMQKTIELADKHNICFLAF